MLLIDSGPAYFKCGLLLEEPLAKDLLLELEAYKTELKYFEMKLTIQYKERFLFFFKINHFKIEKFQKSIDYEIVQKYLKIFISNDDLDVFTEKEIDKHKDSISIILSPQIKCLSLPVCYYCGHLTAQREKHIYELFKMRCVKSGHINQLAIYGLDYLVETAENSFFDLPKQPVSSLIHISKDLKDVTERNQISLKGCLYPYLIANILEGVSVYRVDSIDQFTRLGGATFGATSYWSIVSLACGYEDPEEAVNDAINGNNELIDLSVGDIYGGDYKQFSLDSDLIASSFGKLKYVNDMSNVDNKDISRSLLTLLCANVSQITAMLAKNSNVENVIILGNPFNCLVFMQMVQVCTDYYSGNTVRSVFSDYSAFIKIIGMCRLLEMDNILFSL